MKKIVSIFIVSFMFCVSFAQDIDSLKSLLTKLEGKDKIRVLNELSREYWRNKPEQSIDYAEKAYELAIKTGDKKGESRAYQNKGVAHEYLGNYDLAIEYYKKGLDLAIKINDTEELGFAFINLGIMYYNMEKHNKALEYLQKSLTAYESVGKEHEYANVLNNIGAIYQHKNKFDLAIEYYEKGLEIYLELDIPENISMSYVNLGDVYTKKEEYGIAMEFYKKSLAIRKKINYHWGIASTSTSIAQLHLELKQPIKALKHLQIALENAQKVNDISLLNKIYKLFSEAYSQNQQYRKALIYHRQYTAGRDSLFSAKTSEKLAELEAQHEVEKKEKEIELLNNKNKVQQLELDKNMRVTRYLILLIVFAVLMGLLIYSRYRLKKATNRLLEASNKKLEEANQKLLQSEKELKELNKTKDRFFSIIAHDLRSPFNSMIGFSELLNEGIDKYSKAQIKQYNKLIYESGKNILELLENLLYWARAQTGNLSFYPRKLDIYTIVTNVLNLAQTNAVDKKITLIKNVKSNTFCTCDEDMIETVLRNLVFNALKFSHPKGKIEVKTEKKNTKLIVSVKDDGIGIAKEQLENIFEGSRDNLKAGTSNEQGTGLGLLICKEFIHMHQGEIWVESQIDVGTCFYFSIPTQKPDKKTKHQSNNATEKE